jgi:hypothetical protein
MRVTSEVLPVTSRRLPAPAAAVEEPSLFDEPDPANEPSNGDEGESAESTNQRRKRGEGVGVDRNAGITAAGDVDFYPQGQQTLKEFFAQKGAKSDGQACLAFCYYLQEVLKLPKFGAGHVLAGFNHVEKSIPADLPGTLRNMREGKKGSKSWLAFTDLENIRVTTNGLNQVRHAMGKSKAPEDSGAK